MRKIFTVLILILFLTVGCVRKDVQPVEPDVGEEIECDAVTPCSEGYQCVKLPDKTRPTCITEDTLQSPKYKDCVMLESYPPQLKCPSKKIAQEPYACDEDSDCVIKDVHNCCGYYPRCVNKDYEPDIKAVEKECAEKGRVSVCGFPQITSCKCVGNKCVSM